MYQIIYILPIIAIFLFIFLRKNKHKDSNTNLSSRENRKDEVWRTIKSFLKSNNEFGKEIVSSFVAKRPNIFDKSATRKKFYQEINATIREQKMDRKQAKIYRKQMQLKQNRELYCILFVTRDPKNKIIDPQRIIEAEVKYITEKKERKRDIKINGLVDFEKEFAWMKPLKEKEDKIQERIRKKNKIKAEKKAKAKKRKEERALRKQKKNELHRKS